MPEMDQGIKWLIDHRPADILTLALPGAEYLGKLTTDLATPPQRIADALLRIRFQGVECALHLEAEAYPSEEIAARCLEYGARGLITTRLPVISVVFWLQPQGTPPKSPYTLQVGDWVIAQ